MEYELYHHGILGQKWGIRRYQNPDGTLTPLGKKRAVKQAYNMEGRSGNYRIDSIKSSPTYKNIVYKIIDKTLIPNVYADKNIQKAVKNKNETDDKYDEILNSIAKKYTGHNMKEFYETMSSKDSEKLMKAIKKAKDANVKLNERLSEYVSDIGLSEDEQRKAMYDLRDVLDTYYYKKVSELDRKQR